MLTLKWKNFLVCCDRNWNIWHYHFFYWHGAAHSALLASKFISTFRDVFRGDKGVKPRKEYHPCLRPLSLSCLLLCSMKQKSNWHQALKMGNKIGFWQCNMVLSKREEGRKMRPRFAPLTSAAHILWSHTDRSQVRLANSQSIFSTSVRLLKRSNDL